MSHEFARGFAMGALAALFGAVLAQCARAQDSAMWGNSSATLAPCHAADLCLTVINRLSASPDYIAATVMGVGVFGVMGAGLEPDRITVTPPRGWRVEPEWADIPEDGFQVFRLYMSEVS